MIGHDLADSDSDLGAIFSILGIHWLKSINLVKKEDERIGISGDDFCELRSSLRKWESIHSINIRGNSDIAVDALAKLLTFKCTSRLTSLDMSDINLSGNKIYNSLRSLENLSSLYLAGSLSKQGSLKTLIDTGCIKQLTCLDLSKNTMSSKDLVVLISSDHIKKLTHLYLSDNEIDDKGLKLLARSQYLTKLTNLDLSNNAIEFSDVNSLHNNNLKSLVHINLSHNLKGRRGSIVNDLFNICYKNITYLNLAFSFLITAGTIESLFQANNLENLDFLDISGNSIQGEVMEALARSMIGKLKHLHLNKCSITDKDLAILGSSDWIKNVNHLSLGNNLLTLLGFNTLIESQGFKALTFLDLSGIRICEIGNSITQGNIRNVTSLVLANSRINDDLLKTLVNVLDLKRLIFIDLTNTRVSFSFIKDLIKFYFKSLLSLSLSFDSDKIREMQRDVDSLSEVVTERLTVTFASSILGKNNTQFRTIVPGSRGRSPDNDSSVQWGNDRSHNLSNPLNVISTSGLDLINPGHHSKNATIIPRVVVSQCQANDGSGEASQTPQTETNLHLQVRNASQSERCYSYVDVPVTFIRKKTTVKHPFFASSMDNHAKLSEWMQLSCKAAFPSDIPLAENTTAFGLASSVLDVNCLKLFTDKNLGSLVEIALFECKIGDEGVRFLAENLPPSFTTISIKYSDVTYAGVSYLFRRGLSYINASYCRQNSTSDTSTQQNPFPPSSEDVTFPIGSKLILKDMLMFGGEFKKYFLSGNVNFYGVVQLDLEKNFVNVGDLSALSEKDVSNLAKLDLTNNGLNDDCAVALKNCSFPDSMELNLGNNNIGNSGLQSLLEAVFFEKLSLLRMNNNRFDHKGWEISKTLAFRALQYLNLSENSIGPMGAKLIASHEYPRLQKLYLSSAGIGDEGVKYLAENSFPLLALVGLNSNDIGSAGAVSLAHAAWPRLANLTLDGNPVGRSGVLAFAGKNLQKPRVLSLGIVPHFPPECIGSLFRSSFEVLNIKAVAKTPADVEPYENSGSLDNGQAITFSSNSKFACVDTCMPGGSFAQYFLYGKIDCRGIVHLNLSGNTLSTNDIDAFATANMEQLDILILKNTNINDESLEKLSSISFMRIREIDLSNNSISGEGALKALPSCRWKSTVKVFLFNNGNIDKDHKIRINDSCKIHVLFHQEYDRSRNSSRNSLSHSLDHASGHFSHDSIDELSNDSIVNMKLTGRTSSPNLGSLPTGLTKKSVPSIDNDCSIYSSSPEDGASEILAGTSTNTGNIRVNNGNPLNNSIHFSAKHACAVNESLPSSTSDVAQNSVHNGTTLSKKRARSPNVSPPVLKKCYKSNVHNSIPTSAEREISPLGGSGNFSIPQSNLEHPETSSVSGCSKGKNDRQR